MLEDNFYSGRACGYRSGNRPCDGGDVSPVQDGTVRRRLWYEIVLEQRRVGRQTLDDKQVQAGMRLSEMLPEGGNVSAGMHLSEMLEEGGVFVGPEQGELSDDGEKDG